MNSFTIIFERFCKHRKYLSLSYQNLGAAISMEHLSNCFCISDGDPSPKPHITSLLGLLLFNSLLWYYRNPIWCDRRKNWKAGELSIEKIWVSEITFFIIPPPPNVTFCQLCCEPTSPLSNRRTFWMTPTWH